MCRYIWSWSKFLSVFKYLSSSWGGALGHAARTVGELVLLEVHQGVPLPLDVRLVDAVQGLQAFSGHRVVPAVQRGWHEAPVAVVLEAPGPSAAAGSQGVEIPRELGITGRDHGILSLLSTCRWRTGRENMNVEDVLVVRAALWKHLSCLSVFV